MPLEYRTIQEVAGPLMLVRDVRNVTYNELGEIVLENGETRRCKVLEIDGTNALVQLFESSAGINLSNSKIRFLGRQMELGVSTDMLGRIFDGLEGRLTTVPKSYPKADGRKRPAHQSGGSKLPAGVYRDGHIRHRRAEHPCQGRSCPSSRPAAFPTPSLPPR